MIRAAEFRVARASRVLAKASRLRELPYESATRNAFLFPEIHAAESSFWRDAKTSTARPSTDLPCPLRLLGGTRALPGIRSHGALAIRATSANHHASFHQIRTPFP